MSLKEITLRTEDELAKLRIAGQTAARCLTHLGQFVKPGITTKELDAKAEAFMKENGVTPAFKGYKEYPASICASVNEEVVHSIPGDRVLEEGDIVTLDLGTKYEDYFSDTGVTYLVGEVEPRIKRFVEVGYEALREGIKKAVAGNHVADISNTVYTYIKRNRYGAVKEFVGHGIGTDIHEQPQIPCVAIPKPGEELKNGMVICIEPILTLNPSGKVAPKSKEDRWCIVTPDRCKACHWEHMVAITPSGPEILTLREDEIR